MGQGYSQPTTGSDAPGHNDLPQYGKIYVSQSGSDANSGRSINLPKRTLSAALTAANALGLYSEVEVVSGGIWVEGTTPVVIPASIHLDFGMSSFAGTLRINELCKVDIGGTHFGVAGGGCLVEVVDNIQNSLKFPIYNCSYLNATSTDGSLVGLDGIRCGFGVNPTNIIINVKKCHGRGGSIFKPQAGTKIIGYAGDIYLSADDTLVVDHGGDGSGVNLQFINCTEIGSIDNCIFAAYPSVTGCTSQFMGRNISLNGAASKTVSWAAVDANTMYMVLSGAVYPPVDYANGTVVDTWLNPLS